MKNIKQRRHAELVSASSTLAVSQQQRPTWKIPNHCNQTPDKDLPGRGQAVKAAVWNDNIFYNSNNGFTLIELLVVVLIIGILAAVALPQYKLAVAKSRINRLLPLMKSIENAQLVYHMANNNYATHFEDLDIDMPAGAKATSTASYLEYANFGCTLTGSTSLECWDSKVDGMWLQKYFGGTTTICWTRNANGQKICKYLCKTELTDNACRF